MVQNSSFGDGGAASRLADAGSVLRARDTWCVAARTFLMLAFTLITFSVLAAAIPTFLGMDSFIIDGGSMRPAIPAGALVVAERVDPAIVQAGEIITFRHSTASSSPVTHRVVKVLREANGTTNLLTKGDANASADPEPVATDLPVSRMVYSLPYPGYVLEFLRTGAGKIVLIGVPALLLLLSIGRKSGGAPVASDVYESNADELSEAATEVPAPQKVVLMAMANPASVVPSTPSAPDALTRLAQRPASTPRPGLARRLIAAFQDEPATPVYYEAAPAPVAAPVAQAQPAQATTSPRPVVMRMAAAPSASIYAAPAMAPAMPAPTAMRIAHEVAPPSLQIVAQAAQAVHAYAQTPVSDIGDMIDNDNEPQLLHLARLRLRSVARLADIMQSFDRVETEAAPLLNLVTDLDKVRQRFAENLDEAMRPLTEFADRWDDNLLTLAESMEGDLPQQIDLAAERRRIAEIRAQVPHRHTLLINQFALEKQAIDAALTVFDDQVARLEAQLTAARRTAEAIGDSMRTADFGRTVAFLRRRTSQLAMLAERGAATPEDIAQALPPPPRSPRTTRSTSPTRLTSPRWSASSTTRPRSDRAAAPRSATSRVGGSTWLILKG